MITRRASEIIRLALTMSQIQNADALSWRDKIDMLNQSYIRLYTELNNNGDLYYSKEVVFEPNLIDRQRNSLIMPKDFWKLLLVGHRSTHGEITPIERAPNSGQYFSGYRIINNELFFNNYFAPGPLVVRYIPQPQTITYPRLGYRFVSDATQAGYDSMNNVIVLAGIGNITVLNNSTGEKASINMDDNFIIAISNEIIYVVKRTRIICFDYELNQLSAFNGTFDLYAHSIGWEEGIIVKINGEPMKYISGQIPNESLDYWNFMDGTITRLKTDRITFSFIDAEEQLQDLTHIFEDADSFVIADPFIYINKNGTVIVYDKLEKTNISPAIIGSGNRKGIVLAAEVNNDTGFGAIYRDFHSGLNLIGFATDTVMNYPQNIFFEWLSTDLAVKFRMALDIPTQELPALAADYYDTLMKSLSRDAYMSQRINNLYGRAFL